MSVESSLELNVILQQVRGLCAFSGGQEQIDACRPSFNPLVIQRDNAWIREALECVRVYGPMPFGGIRDLRRTFENAEKGMVLGEQDFLSIIHAVQGVKGVMNYAKELTETEHTHLDELIGSLVVHDSLLRTLTACFNEYGEVKDNATEELKNIRISLRRLNGEISDAANRFRQKHASSLVDSIVTERSGRMVVLVRASEKNMFGGMVYGDSASGAASYVEPAAFVPLNNRRESMRAREQEEIHRILVKCSKAAGDAAPQAIANIETLSILDAVFAKAQWGVNREACAAELTDDRRIVIERARHPLIAREKVVANTYHLEEPKRILLITGPNTGGKTVSMKVIGLFVLMTYCGMPVTCDHAVLPYFDRVFADIGDDQSVVSSLSSFSAHMTKQAEVCHKATSRSLVLLDEVGSGTDPAEGEALAIAILNELREKQCMTVTTTHYNRLKAYGKRHDDILLASVSFDMETLTPTYRYIEGLTGQSNAFEVAEKYGLPKHIIKYARFLKSQAKNEEDELIEKLEKQLNENAAKQEELDALLAENRKQQSEWKKKNADLERNKDRIMAKAEKEAQAYVEETEKKADTLLAEIRASQASVKYHTLVEKRHEIENAGERRHSNEGQNEVPKDYTYHVGDAVELRSSSQVCEIVRIEKKDITIRLNGRDIRVKKNQIRPSDRIIAKVKEQPVIAVHQSSLFASVPAEVNLIGLYVDEAMEKLDAYLDQVKVAGLKTCRVIHGDGSGALRKAVHRRLASDSSVKSFRLGTPGEGGTGATVVVMK